MKKYRHNNTKFANWLDKLNHTDKRVFIKWAILIALFIGVAIATYGLAV